MRREYGKQETWMLWALARWWPTSEMKSAYLLKKQLIRIIASNNSDCIPWCGSLCVREGGMTDYQIEQIKQRTEMGISEGRGNRVIVKITTSSGKCELLSSLTALCCQDQLGKKRNEKTIRRVLIASLRWSGASYWSIVFHVRNSRGRASLRENFN